MQKTKKQRVRCEVTSCVYNEGGVECKKDEIVIARDGKDDTTHYCKSFEHGCGFKQD